MQTLPGITILVVDDNAYNRDLLRFMLEDDDYSVITAKNGSDAIDQFSKNPDIAIILMDVEMPVMDGRVATRVIKRDFAERFVPILFVTALGEEQALAECLEAGGDDFVSKPVSRSVLLAKISAHHRTVRLYQELQESNRTLSYHQKLIEREHAIVEHIFKNSMSRVDTQCQNLCYHISPMSMFNGDLLLASPSPSGGLYVLLGDFTGHGLSAAIGCLPVSDIFYSMCRQQLGVSEIAMEMNRKLQTLLPSNMFFCASILEVSAGGDRISYWAGGMNDMLLLHPDNKSVHFLRSQHMPLGVLRSHEFDARSDVISPPMGSRLLIYTDGIIESQNDQGEMFGEDRLHALLQGEFVGSYCQMVAEAVYNYRESASQTDDMSLAEVICQPVIHDTDLIVSPLDITSSTAKGFAWQVSLTLTSDDFRQKDMVHQIVNMIKGNSHLTSHLDILFTLISELYSNSLEHGILRLDSKDKSDSEGYVQYYRKRTQLLDTLTEGAITIEFSVAGPELNCLFITVTDTGDGFDYVSVGSSAAEATIYGRGIELIRSLCESVTYSDGGRKVQVSYRLD